MLNLGLNEPDASADRSRDSPLSSYSFGEVFAVALAVARLDQNLWVRGMVALITEK